MGIPVRCSGLSGLLSCMLHPCATLYHSNWPTWKKSDNGKSTKNPFLSFLCLPPTHSLGCFFSTFGPVWLVLKTLAEKLASLHLQLVHKWQELIKEVQKYIDEQAKKQKTVRIYCLTDFLERGHLGIKLHSTAVVGSVERPVWWYNVNSSDGEISKISMKITLQYYEGFFTTEVQNAILYSGGQESGDFTWKKSEKGIFHAVCIPRTDPVENTYSDVFINSAASDFKCPVIGGLP